MIIEGMAQQGAEPTYCMGDDIPLAVLSDKPHMLYNYFKQRFAQVTNPPIDPLREGLVMSMTMRLGKRGNLLQPGPDAYSQVGPPHYSTHPNTFQLSRCEGTGFGYIKGGLGTHKLFG